MARPCALALGDNLIHRRPSLDPAARGRRQARSEGATVFAYQVRDPERYGVVSFDETGRAVEIVEKPALFISSWAVTGLYFYDHRVADLALHLKPSPRGELEITDLNKIYLEEGTMHVERLGRGCAWLDAGMPDSLLQAATFVQTIQERQGMLVGCPEEVAYRMGYIDVIQLRRLANGLAKDRARAHADRRRGRASRMNIEQLAIEGVILVTPPRFADARGHFSETFNVGRFAAAGILLPFVQDNQSLSRPVGTIRGLHCQIAPNPQGKLVRVLRGSIWDVAVDIRMGSPTYGQHVGATLSARTERNSGCPLASCTASATLEPDTEVLYKVSGQYDRAAERGVRWNDETLALPWPVAPGAAVLSDKDQILPGFDAAAGWFPA